MEKETQDAFADCHPIVNFIYFVSVIAFGMMSLHPVCLMIAFIGAFAYSVCLGGRKAVLRNLRYMIPVIILTALINPAFSHQGVTVFPDRKCIDAGIHIIWACGSRDACNRALLVCLA